MASVVLDDGNFAGSVNQNVLVAAGAKLGGAGLTTSGSIVSGATVVNGNETVNGTLTVVQPQGGGTRTAYFTDGGVGALENSVAIFNDQTATSLVFNDSGNSGILAFAGSPGTGYFQTDRDLRVNNSTLTVIQPAGGGVRTAYFTDGNVGVAENSLAVFTDQTSTTFVFTDSGQSGNMTFEGTTGLFGFSSQVNFPAVQAGRALSIPTGTAINVAGMTANSIVIATQEQVPGETTKNFVVDATAGFFTIVFAEAGPGTFNWFVARL